MLRRDPNSIEALVSLASIHTHLTFERRAAADSLAERNKAKDLFDQVERIFSLAQDTISPEGEKILGIPMTERISEVANDPELFIEIGKIYSEDFKKSLKSFKKAEKIIKEELKEMVPPRLLNNIAVLEIIFENYGEAQEGFEIAVTEVGKAVGEAGGVLTEELDGLITALTFNLGVISEILGEKDEARGSFERVLAQHPEFVDGE